MVNILELKQKAQSLNNIKAGLNKELEKIKLEKQSLKTKIEMNDEKIKGLVGKLHVCLLAIGYDVEEENIIDNLDTIATDIDAKLTTAIQQLNQYEEMLKAI